VRAVAVLAILLSPSAALAIPNCPPGMHVVSDPQGRPGGSCEADAPAASASATTVAPTVIVKSAEPSPSASTAAAAPAKKEGCNVHGSAGDAGSVAALAAIALGLVRRRRR
jgi:MYXO-CTERM domain-containing protein